jgi:predicted metal-dependent phosphoesterase TrpH
LHQMLSYESLHNHTTASDGTQSYLEVLATAEANGLGIVAFTDHDMLPSAADLKALREYTGSVKWFLGCEISSGLPKELGSGATSNIHILGLFTDPTNQALLDHCTKALAARNERMQKIVGNLKGLGFKINVEDALKAAGGESVGRPHIVRALNSYPENAAVIEGIRAEMEKAAVSSASVAMDYAHMIERPAGDFPYRLFLSDDAFVSGIYVESLYWVDMDAAVGLIRGAGGVAIMAHWYTAAKKVDAGMLESMIKAGRLDGVEIMGNPLNPSARRAEGMLSALAARTGTLATYGVDGHREQDIENFVKDKGVAGKSIGQTARVIERAKPDLSFSNLE